METLNVDMMAEARNAQLSAADLLGPGAVKVISPAKVNLFLAVGERRADGYHDVVSVFHALALHDTLHMKRDPRPWRQDDTVNAAALPDQMAIVGPSDNVLVSVFSADKTGKTVQSLAIPAADNLAVQALDALAKKIGYTAEERIAIHIEKHIPAQAGLGGGSSNAAAALLAAARIWGVASDGHSLRDAATQLGADVAFFHEGGCAVMDGIGDHLAGRLEPMNLPVVLVKPSQGVSTAEAYAHFDAQPQFASAELLAQVEEATSATEVPLYNNLSTAAEQIVPELEAIHTWLAQQTAPDQVLLTGSGSCTFAITEGFAQASRIAAAAQAQGWWARPTTLSRLKAALV